MNLHTPVIVSPVFLLVMSFLIGAFLASSITSSIKRRQTERQLAALHLRLARLKRAVWEKHHAIRDQLQPPIQEPGDIAKEMIMHGTEIVKLCYQIEEIIDADTDANSGH